MYKDAVKDLKELLRLANKLAGASDKVCECSVMDVSLRIINLKSVLKEYYKIIGKINIDNKSGKSLLNQILQ